MRRNFICILLVLLVTASSALAQDKSASAWKHAFNQVERIPRRNQTEEQWHKAQAEAARKALSQLSEPVGDDLYYAAELELKAGEYKKAVEHFKLYLAMPEANDYERKTSRRNAQIRLRDSFIAAGMEKEGEKYYSSDPLTLGLFISMQKKPERALKTYEDFLASNPPQEKARRAKAMIMYSLQDLGRPDEVAARLEQYQADLTPNNIVNTYSSLARMYERAGNVERAQEYTDRVLEMGREPRGKAVDGPVSAHIEWIIQQLENSGDKAKLNAFIHRVRTELAANSYVMGHLDAREQSRAIVNHAAKELEVDYIVNGSSTTLKDLRGRVVLLDFFAHWCGPCIAGFPGVRDLQKRYEPKGLTVLGLSGIYGTYKGERNVSEKDEVRRMKTDFAKEYEVTWPMLFTKAKTNDKNYGISYIPHLILIDRKGVVRHSIAGKGFDEKLEEYIQNLLSEAATAGQD